MTEKKPSHSSQNSDAQKIASVLSVEREACEQEDELSLLYVMANSTYRVVSYQRLFFFKAENSNVVASAASSQTNLERQSPFVGWAEQFLQRYIQEHDESESGFWEPQKDDLPSHDQDSWSEWVAGSLSIIPVQCRGQVLGYLWFERDQPIQEMENKILKHLANIYALCLLGFEKDAQEKSFSERFLSFFMQGRKRWIVAALIALLLFPVRHSILVPAEVVPKEPAIMTASLNGTIEDIFVEPYEFVKAGDFLFSLDQKDWEAEEKVVSEQLRVTEARWQTALRNAFRDEKSKRDIEQLAAEVEAKQADLDALRSILGRGEVVSPVDGVVVFSNKSDLIGLPVQTGERVMMIADPGRVELQFYVPSDDLIRVNGDIPLAFLPDIRPLNDYQTTLNFVAYEAVQGPEGDVVYPGYARFDNDQVDDIPIGAKGVARLYGRYTILGYKWFHKPIRLLRRSLGF